MSRFHTETRGSWTQTLKEFHAHTLTGAEIGQLKWSPEADLDCEATKSVRVHVQVQLGQESENLVPQQVLKTGPMSQETQIPKTA